MGAVGEDRDDGAIRVGDDRRGPGAELPASADDRAVPPASQVAEFSRQCHGSMQSVSAAAAARQVRTGGAGWGGVDGVDKMLVQLRRVHLRDGHAARHAPARGTQRRSLAGVNKHLKLM